MALKNSGVTMVVFPCICKHRNKVANSARECYRLFILDQLGTCKKCGRSLRKSSFAIKKTKTYKEVEAEISNLR